MNEELVRLREFAHQFRVWQRAMNNHSFRSLLATLDEAERARLESARLEMESQQSASDTATVPCAAGVCE